MRSVTRKQEIKLKHNITEWPKSRLNFWGIPKCANTAVKAALYEKEYGRPISDWRRVHEVRVSRYISRGAAFCNGYENFSVVRHPYGRVASLYRDFGLRRPEHVQQRFAVSKRSLKDLDRFLDICIRGSDDTPDTDVHFRSMASFLCTLDGRLAVGGICDVKDLHLLSAEYGLQVRALNVSDKAEVSLNDNQKEIIQRRYAKDFELFGYSTEEEAT